MRSCSLIGTKYVVLYFSLSYNIPSFIILFSPLLSIMTWLLSTIIWEYVGICFPLFTLASQICLLTAFTTQNMDLAVYIVLGTIQLWYTFVPPSLTSNPPSPCHVSCNYHKLYVYLFKKMLNGVFVRETVLFVESIKLIFQYLLLKNDCLLETLREATVNKICKDTPRFKMSYV